MKLIRDYKYGLESNEKIKVLSTLAATIMAGNTENFCYSPEEAVTTALKIVEETIEQLADRTINTNKAK